MTNFEAKIYSALQKLEAEGKIVIKDDHIFPAGDWAKTEEKSGTELIDPMAIEESSEALEAKKQKWMDIFMFRPDLADRLINLNADKMLERAEQWLNIYTDHNEFAENVILSLVDAYGDEVYESLCSMYNPNDKKVSLGWIEKEENK